MMDFEDAKITSGVGFLLLCETEERFGILGSHLGEGTRSTSRLTEGARVGYVQILKKGSLIWHKCGNWNRWTIFGRAAAPIRGSKSIAELVIGQNDRHL